MTFIGNVSDPLYADLNKTSDFWTKFSLAIKLGDGEYKVVLVNFIIKNKHDVIRTGTLYEIKVRPFDFSDEG